MLPPMNWNSITPITIGISVTVALPRMIALANPVFSCASSMRFGYGLVSVNVSGSSSMIGSEMSMNVPGSISDSSRSLAVRKKYAPQWGQMLLFSRTRRLNTSWPHDLHLIHRLSSSFLSRSTRKYFLSLNIGIVSLLRPAAGERVKPRAPRWLGPILDAQAVREDSTAGDDH